MNRRLFAIILLIIGFAASSHAVLKEKDLESSLAVLRHQLIEYHNDQNRLMMNSQLMSAEVRETMSDVLNRSSENSIMLYSQNSNYVFDITYACHEATEQYKEFQRKTAPFKLFIAQSNNDIARYDSLINVLSTMPTFGLTERAKTDRNVCLTLAVNLRRILVDNNNDLQEYILWYDYADKRLYNLNSYAMNRYETIQRSIFLNGGENYIHILRNYRDNIKTSINDFEDKYTPKSVNTQWDVRWIIGLFSTIFIYGIIVLMVNFFSIRVLVTKLMTTDRFKDQEEGFLQKRKYIILTTSVITFGILAAVIRALSTSSFVSMACGLLINYSWLLTAVCLSLLLRVRNDQIKNALFIYTPILIGGAIVFIFRIVLIPNNIINLIFPPILLAGTLWQLHMLKKLGKEVPRYDLYLASFSMFVFAVATISAWTGYTLLSVQILVWWLMMMTCILTLACVHGWMAQYREKRGISSMPVNKVWLFRLMYFVVLPILFVCSFLISIYWAAQLFNLSDLTYQLFMRNFIDSENFKVSIFGIVQVINLYFVFNYLNHTIRDIVKLWLQRKDPSTAASRSVMFINVLQVVVWGIWLLIVLAILDVSNTWLVVVSGGLSTGIGFAMKDILENIYYGISLMAGRIKLGDYIICDGIRGRVSNISYTSTQLEALDGSVIAFTNSQLFTKNYKNMTKNHGNELDVLEVGVAYGTDIAHCKDVLQTAIMQLDCIDKGRGVKILLKSFDDSCITLKIVVWVNVLTQASDDGEIMECIYNTLNENKIEIPFPQREITIKSNGDASATMLPGSE